MERFGGILFLAAAPATADLILPAPTTSPSTARIRAAGETHSFTTAPAAPAPAPIAAAGARLISPCCRSGSHRRRRCHRCRRRGVAVAVVVTNVSIVIVDIVLDSAAFLVADGRGNVDIFYGDVRKTLVQVSGLFGVAGGGGEEGEAVHHIGTRCKQDENIAGTDLPGQSRGLPPPPEKYCL